MPVQGAVSPNSGVIIPKPKTFDKMIEFSGILSKDMPFVRVDFYEVNGKLYFGELTLYPASGFKNLNQSHIIIYSAADYNYLQKRLDELYYCT